MDAKLMPAHLPDHAWYVTKTYEAQSLTDPRSKSSAWGSANKKSPKPTSRVRTTAKQKKILTIRGILEINLPPWSVYPASLKSLPVSN